MRGIALLASRIQISPAVESVNRNTADRLSLDKPVGLQAHVIWVAAPAAGSTARTPAGFEVAIQMSLAVFRSRDIDGAGEAQGRIGDAGEGSRTGYIAENLHLIRLAIAE